MKILSIILLFVSITCYAPTFNTSVGVHLVEKNLEHSEFSLENLILYVQLMDSTNSKAIIQQAILETGHFKSRLFKSHNNLFGMKFANKRPNKISGKAMGHASFEHWTDSVKDYFMWRSYMIDKKHLTTTDYYTFLKKVGYAVDPNYIKILKKIKVNV